MASTTMRISATSLRGEVPLEALAARAPFDPGHAVLERDLTDVDGDVLGAGHGHVEVIGATGDRERTGDVRAGDNITDEDGITGGLPRSTAGARGEYFYVTRPRTIGLAVRFSSN